MSRENINPIELRKTIGAKLKTARLEKGFTQEELGSELGVSRVVIGMYEKGRLRISIQLLIQLSKILQKPIHFFVDEDKTVVDAYEKNKEQKSYQLNENIEFTLEMAIRNYLRAHGHTQNISEKCDQVFDFIKNKLRTP